MPQKAVFGLAALLLPTALFPASGGHAEEADAGRFQLERSGDHFIRLDRRSGAMSICRDQEGNLVCRMAADERAAYEDELDRLSERVSKLEKTVAVSDGSVLPDDADVDRALGIMQKFMRGFMDMTRELRKDKPQPQRL